MKGLLIHGATIVTMDPHYDIIDNGYLLVQGSIIQELGPGLPEHLKSQHPDESRPGIRSIDARGKIIFPGLVNTHCHLFQSLLKGMGAGKSLEEWWPSTIGPAATALEATDVRYAALAGGIEALRSGTTTILDFMYAHPRPHLSDEVILALSDVGLRCVYARAFRDSANNHFFPQNLVERTGDVLEDVSRLVRVFDSPSTDGMIRIWLAPTAIWGVSDEALVMVRRFANENGIGITMHLCETSTDDAVTMEKYGMGAVELLNKTGILGPDFLAVHCVMVDEDDVKRIADSGTAVSHNVVSNMYLGSGVAPVPAMLSNGITLSLGTDGAASNNSLDMLETIKFTSLVHNGTGRSPLMLTARQALEMATIGGAKALGMESEIGSLTPGKRADFFIYNPLKAKSCPVHDPIASLSYSSGTENVETVVVNGQVVLEGGELCSLDEEDILKFTATRARELSARTGRNRREQYASR